jgi:hypothetical protein
MGFAGPAAQAKVELKAGTLDLDSDLTLAEVGPDHGAIRERSDSVFTDLDVSEPRGGWLQEHLELPAPLNVAVFALRDDDGAVDIPLAFELDDWTHLSWSKLRLAITKTALGVLSRLILNAIKNSPFRALGTVEDLGKDVLSVVPGADLVPFMSEAPKSEGPPMVLDFAAGDVALTTSNTTGLAELAAKLKADEKLTVTLRHDVGGGDLERARVTTNPCPRDRKDLIARLEAKRDGLERERLDTAAEARAALAAGIESSAADARRHAQAIDAELVQVSRGLDQLYELEREGSDRQAERRARLACRELARARLDAVKHALVGLGVERPDDRIHVARPRFEENDGHGGGTVSATLRESKGH